MASETLRAILTAVWQGGSATAKAATDIERVGGSTEKTRDRLERLGAGLSEATKAFGVIAGGVKLAWNVIGQGAELELARSRFDKLAESIGSTSDALMTDLRAATGGMLSDAQLMASASQIISLGLFDTQQDVVRLATVIGELGLDMGQVILTLANDSKLRLDALGLSIEDVEARTQKFIDAGHEMSEAFDLAVLEALEGRVELLGSTTDSTVGDMRLLTAELENMKNALLEQISVAAGPAIHQAAGGYAKDLQVMIDAQMATIDSTEDLIAQGQKLSGITYFQQWFTGTLHAVDASEAGIIEGLARVSGSVDEFIANVQAAFGDDTLIADLDLHTGSVSELEAAYNNITAASEEAAIASYEIRRAGAEVAATFDGPVASAFEAAMASAEAYAESVVSVADATYEMRREGIDSSEALRAKLVSDYEAQVEATEALEQATRELATAYASEFSEALNASDEETQNFTSTMLDSAVQAGASAEALYALALATGEYTEEQIEAALKTAAMATKAQELGVAIAEGTITVQDAIAELQNFQATLDNPYEILVDSEQARLAEQRARAAKLAVMDLDGSHANVTVTTHFQTQGTPYSGPYDLDAPGYASGTDGWEMVPGPVGAPFPVTLHGGEQFNVVPAGQQGESGGNSVYNINLIIDGTRTNVRGADESDAEPLLRAARGLGVPI